MVPLINKNVADTKKKKKENISTKNNKKSKRIIKPPSFWVKLHYDEWWYNE